MKPSKRREGPQNRKERNGNEQHPESTRPHRHVRHRRRRAGGKPPRRGLHSAQPRLRHGSRRVRRVRGVPGLRARQDDGEKRSCVRGRRQGVPAERLQLCRGRRAGRLRYLPLQRPGAHRRALGQPRQCCRTEPLRPHADRRHHRGLRARQDRGEPSPHRGVPRRRHAGEAPREDPGVLRGRRLPPAQHWNRRRALRSWGRARGARRGRHPDDLR